MTRIEKLRQVQQEQLEACCKENNVSFASMQILLEAQKTRKLLKRGVSIQQVIEREINNAIEHED